MNRQPLWGNDPSQYYKPVSQQQLTVDGTVRAPTIPSAQVRGARMFVVGGPVRITLDGSAPVGGSNGLPLYDGQVDYWNANELTAMKLIRDGATNATVYFIYYI